MTTGARKSPLSICSFVSIPRCPLRTRIIFFLAFFLDGALRSLKSSCGRSPQHYACSEQVLGMCVCVCVCVCVCCSVVSDSLLCNRLACSLPGSSVHRILQARILKWVPILFSRGSSQPRDGTPVSCILYHLRHLGNPGFRDELMIKMKIQGSCLIFIHL